jgi:hypothetical protein
MFQQRNLPSSSRDGGGGGSRDGGEGVADNYKNVLTSNYTVNGYTLKISEHTYVSHISQLHKFTTSKFKIVKRYTSCASSGYKVQHLFITTACTIGIVS